MVQTVRATDRDTGKYGEIVYSLEGQGSDAFTIDPKHGHIQVNLYFFNQFVYIFYFLFTLFLFVYRSKLLIVHQVDVPILIGKDKPNTV